MAKDASQQPINIAEVSELTGIKAHVLRYWETEFPQLKPEKTRGNQRLYKTRDVDLVLKIKRLLYDEKYTIAGARQRLDEDRKEAKKQAQLPLGLDLGHSELVGALVKARRLTRGLLDALDRSNEDA